MISSFRKENKVEKKKKEPENVCVLKALYLVTLTAMGSLE